MDSFRVVELRWLDSVGQGTWHSFDTALQDSTTEAMHHRTVGYVLHEADDYVLVAGSISESKVMVSDTMQIPRVAIIEIVELGPSKGR